MFPDFGLKTFNIGGETLAQVCRRAGVSYWGVLHRIKDNGSTPQGNCAHFEEKRRLGIRSPKPVPIMVGEFRLSEACRRAEVPYYGVWSRIRHKGETPEQAIAYFKTRGVSLAGACRLADVPYYGVWSRIKYKGESSKQAIAHFKTRGKTRGGKLAEACRRAGVSYEGTRQRIKLKGETPEQAMTHFVTRNLENLEKQKL